MADVEALLTELGFGEYEARAYVALLQRSPLNGYELAKLSGIPRGNVYAVLEKLEGRGAVMRLEAPDTLRYAPVPPRELLPRMSAGYRQVLSQAEQALSDISAPLPADYVWNAQGYPVLLEHARTLVDAAERELLLAVWPAESQLLAENVAGAAGRGVEISTLCLAACPNECGACRGSIHRHSVAPAQGTRWLVVIPDGREALTGEITPDGEGRPAASAVRTRQRLLVEVIASYIRDSIALAAMLADLGPRLESMLSSGARSALATLHPFAGQIGWLDHVRHLLAAKGAAGPEKTEGERRQPGLPDS